MHSRNQSMGKNLLVRMLGMILPVIMAIAFSQNSEAAKLEHIRTACMNYETGDSTTGHWIGEHYDYANGGYSTRLRGIRAASQPTMVLQYTATSSFYCEQGYHDCDSIAAFCARTGYNVDSMYLQCGRDSVNILDYDVAAAPCVAGHVNRHGAGDQIRICEFNTWRAMPNYRYPGVWAYLKKYYGETMRTHNGVIEDYAAEWSRPAYPYRWGYTSYPWGTPQWLDTSQVRNIAGWTSGGLNGRQISDSLIVIKRNHWLPMLLDTIRAVTGGNNYFTNGSGYGDLGCDLFEDCIRTGASTIIGEYVWISNGINWPGVWAEPSMPWAMMDSIRQVHNGAKVQLWVTVFPQDSVILGSWARAYMERLCFYYMAADTEHTIFLFSNSTTSAHGPNQFYAGDTLFLWQKALEHNIGQPTAERSSQSIGGTTVYRRPYSRALVYWRQASGGTGGNYGPSSAVSFDLGGTYRELYADNTLGPQTTTGQIRNCEGKIYIPAFGDSIPPARIHDLGAVPGEQGQYILSWTAPGDDGNEGIADHYSIRYSSNFISDDNWSSYPVISNAPSPLPAGQRQQITFDVPNYGEKYYIAIKAFDEAGNVSPLSNVDSLIGGIGSPVPLSTIIDTTLGRVTLYAGAVNSNHPLYYEFALDTTLLFSSPSIQVSLISDTAVSSTYSDLDRQKTYAWRCRARCNSPTDSSRWSAITSFFMPESPAPLAAVDCIYPPAGATVNTSTPELTSNGHAGVTQIYFEIDTTTSFSTALNSGAISVESSGSASWQVRTLLQNGVKYYWRASSDDQLWTAPYHFFVALSIHAFPNPFRASDNHSVITFTNLPQNSNITIATVSGAIIKQAHNVGPGDWIWDLKNSDGDYITSGVYLNSVDYSTGSSTGKLVVIR
jgi:hypothetical protein